MQVKNLLSENPTITEIVTDSREVTPGSVFVAVNGNAINGEQYIPDAIKKGAKIIVVANDYNPASNLTQNAQFIQTDNTRLALFQLSHIFYKPIPSNIAAVTGTNGKTSVICFLQSLLNTAHIPCITIGTLGISSPQQHITTNNTCPDSVTIHKALRQASQNKINYAAIEATSHGIDQYRIGPEFANIAAFTNLTHDHLDYHQTMQNYWDTKKRLFSEILQKDGCAVINYDFAQKDELINICKSRNIQIMQYGSQGDVSLVQKPDSSNNYTACISVLGKKESFTTDITGDFQLQNLLCALAIAEGYGIKISSKALSTISCVPGRMESIQYESNVFIADYAHNPDALNAALTAASNHFPDKKLITVFGCGGNRDKDKRPTMGNIAASKSWLTIVTDDNPRDEDLSNIRKDIIAGIDKSANFLEVEGRANAIQDAVKIAKKNGNTIVLVAGKGHEGYQMIRNTKLPTPTDMELLKEFVL